jgi:hypothetical protein
MPASGIPLAEGQRLMMPCPTCLATFIIEFSDGQEMTREADHVDVVSGALVFTTGTETTLIVASRVWRSVRINGADPPPRSGHRQSGASESPPQPSRRESQRILGQATDIADPLR